MKMRGFLLFGAAVGLVCLPATVIGQWSENFDSYADGSSMHGQGDWKGWGDDEAYTAYVSSVQSLSSPHSVDISDDADLVHEYEGYTEGLWIYTAWQYIPEDFDGESYFILLNSYDDAGSSNNWSTQVRFDSDLGVVESEHEDTQLDLITGRWVELRNEIDLDNDLQSIYYDGELLSSKSWTDGVSGDGELNIAAVDLYANSASPVYYDDISLVPEPASCLLLALAAVFGLRHR